MELKVNIRRRSNPAGKTEFDYRIAGFSLPFGGESLSCKRSLYSRECVGETIDIVNETSSSAWQRQKALISADNGFVLMTERLCIFARVRFLPAEKDSSVVLCTCMTTYHLRFHNPSTSLLPPH